MSEKIQFRTDDKILQIEQDFDRKFQITIEDETEGYRTFIHLTPKTARSLARALESLAEDDLENVY
jgi:hypothetical protein